MNTVHPLQVAFTQHCVYTRLLPHTPVLAVYTLRWLDRIPSGYLHTRGSFISVPTVTALPLVLPYHTTRATTGSRSGLPHVTVLWFCRFCTDFVLPLFTGLPRCGCARGCLRLRGYTFTRLPLFCTRMRLVGYRLLRSGPHWFLHPPRVLHLLYTLVVRSVTAYLYCYGLRSHVCVTFATRRTVAVTHALPHTGYTHTHCYTHTRATLPTAVAVHGSDCCRSALRLRYCGSSAVLPLPLRTFPRLYGIHARWITVTLCHTAFCYTHAHCLPLRAVYRLHRVLRLGSTARLLRGSAIGSLRTALPAFLPLRTWFTLYPVVPVRAVRFTVRTVATVYAVRTRVCGYILRLRLVATAVRV